MKRERVCIKIIKSRDNHSVNPNHQLRLANDSLMCTGLTTNEKQALYNIGKWS